MITQIEFPNTAPFDETSNYVVTDGDADEIKPITKSGEMSLITWFQVIKNGMVIAEIKESVCNVYYTDKKATEDIF